MEPCLPTCVPCGKIAKENNAFSLENLLLLLLYSCCCCSELHFVFQCFFFLGLKRFGCERTPTARCTPHNKFFINFFSGVYMCVREQVYISREEKNKTNNELTGDGRRGGEGKGGIQNGRVLERYRRCS